MRTILYIIYLAIMAGMGVFCGYKFEITHRNWEYWVLLIALCVVYICGYGRGILTQ